MKQNLLKLLITVIIFQSGAVYAEDKPSNAKLEPLFNLDSSRTFSPDFSTSNNNTKEEVNKDKTEPKTTKKSVDVRSLKFQVSNPKDVMLPTVVTDNKVSVKPDAIVDQKKESTSKELKAPMNDDINKHSDLKPKIDIPKKDKEKVTTETKTEKNTTDKPKVTIKPEDKHNEAKKSDLNKPNALQKLDDKTKKEVTPAKNIQKAEIKPVDNKPSTSVAKNNKPLQTKETEPKIIKQENKKAIITISPPIVKKTKPDVTELPKLESIEVHNQSVNKEEEKVLNSQPQSITEANNIGSVKEKTHDETKNSVDKNNQPLSEQNNDIDFYLKKYNSTLQGNANVSDYKASLIVPFKESLFYKVLQENKAEGIELQTYDINANLSPEAVVSYNVPLGGEGEYACQVLVLEPKDAELNKLWVSELIPGKIDSVQIQDVNNDGQNDIIVISTTGGVSLLKSIRVYSYEKPRNSFNTIFAMNSIMEGIVTVKQNKILISETFPGGINRAALYMWNGQRFERLEL